MVGGGRGVSGGRLVSGGRGGGLGLGVVISDGVGEGVGGNLIGVGLSLVGGGSVVSRGGGVVSGGGVHSVVDRGHNHGGVVDGVVSHGVDSVSQDVGVGVVTSIRTGSHDGEESSSDESLHFCSIG